MDLQEIRKKLKKDLDKARYEHTKGVMYTAACLAMAYGYPVEKAMLAGLLHDCAKCLPTEEKQKLCEEHHILVSEVELENPGLLHAKAGMALAEEKYVEFQSNEINDDATVETLKSIIAGRNVMVIAPGPSLTETQAALKQLANEKNCVVISATFVPDFIETDYVFLSNLKRYNTTFNPTHKQINLIHTSNIKVEETEKMVVNTTLPEIWQRGLRIN